MTQRQQESSARYLYDVSKIVLAASVVGKLVAGSRIDVLELATGISIAYLCFWWGHLLDGMQE